MRSPARAPHATPHAVPHQGTSRPSPRRVPPGAPGPNAPGSDAPGSSPATRGAVYGAARVPPPSTASPRPDSGGRGGKPEAPKKTKRRRKPIGSILLVVLGVLVIVASGGTYVAVNKVIGTVTKAIPTTNLLGDQKATGASINGVLNILMVGVDTRPGNTIGSRSDSIIIAHIPASHDSAYFVSIPRDTLAAIPDHGTQKINAAFQIGSSNGGGYAGGFQELAKTLKSDYGLTFNAGAIVNFDGFESIVKVLGGVTMYVDEKTTSLHHGYKLIDGKKVFAAPFSTKDNGLHWSKVPGVTPVVYQQGTQHLTPSEALDFVRIRDFLPNGDYDRERHQQQFIKALMQEAVHQGISDPLKIGTFLTSISKAITLDYGGFSASDWIFTLKGINPANILTIKTNNGTYNTKVVNGQDEEVLDPVSLELLNDVKSDQLGSFIQKYPSWVSTS
jgi:LCP family protein required for cell wall assembly